MAYLNVLLILKERTTLKKKGKNIITSILIIVSLFMYLYGYKICKVFYDSTGLTGQEKKDVIKGFWDLRFSLYSVIIAIIYYVSRLDLTRFHKMLLSIGFNLALISAVDKLILREFDVWKYDILIILLVLLTHIYRYRKLNNHGKT